MNRSNRKLLLVILLPLPLESMFQHRFLHGFARVLLPGCQSSSCMMAARACMATWTALLWSTCMKLESDSVVRLTSDQACAEWREAAHTARAMPTADPIGDVMLFGPSISTQTFRPSPVSTCAGGFGKCSVRAGRG